MARPVEPEAVVEGIPTFTLRDEDREVVAEALASAFLAALADELDPRGRLQITPGDRALHMIKRPRTPASAGAQTTRRS